ncbi:MAG: hypothetical protein ACE5F1_14655 [Planctomycetota bacterium]
MDLFDLTCTYLSSDGRIAYFQHEHCGEDQVFAYLPHVYGLNPCLLKVGDILDGRVERLEGRIELVEAFGQREDRRQQLRPGSIFFERTCRPGPFGQGAPDLNDTR